MTLREFLNRRIYRAAICSAIAVVVAWALTIRAPKGSPDRELTELRQAAGALGAVGWNLDQIARVAHQTGRGRCIVVIKTRQSFRASVPRWCTACTEIVPHRRLAAPLVTIRSLTCSILDEPPHGPHPLKRAR